MSSVDAAAMPRSAPSVVSAHQVRVDSLDAGATTREMTSASARSRSAQAGPSNAGRPSFAAIPVGAPQVGGLVLAAPALLVGVAAADPGHVHRRRLTSHTPMISENESHRCHSPRFLWLRH